MRIVVLHAGGLGDLVLVESYLAALRERHPGARLELVCRADVAPVAGLYAAPPDAVLPFGFNPYRWALPDDRAALEAKTLLRALGGEPADLFVSAELRATWLSEILAAALAPGEALISDERKPRPSDLLILLGKLGLARNGAVRRLRAAEGEHELDRYARLAGGGARRLPALRPPGAPPSGELVVFPLASSRINRWPLAAMGKAALQVAAAREARIVLVGGEKDRDALDGALADGTFGPGAQLMAGAPEDLPAVAARIAAATGYLGIETGLVHLAAAYGVPGATVYGGGYWPTYGPWAARSAAVVAPIPCFGCEWDCAFDRPFCLEGVDPDSAAAAFEAAFADGSGMPLARMLEPYGPRERAIFGTAAAVHRAAQHDRAARLTAITRLRDVLARYARRTRSRTRRVNAALDALARRTALAARRLDEARTGDYRTRAAARRSGEQ
jgi:ADP-heptose:LPS heptosyltransferase